MTSATAPKRLFFVQESETLIAADLIDALQMRFDANVIHAQSADSWSEKLAGVTALDAALLEMRPSDFVVSDKREMILSLCDMIVFTIGEGEKEIAAANGWHMLARPFTDDMISDVLTGN